MEEEDPYYEYENIASIPIPEGLPPDIQVEYTVYRESLVQLENEWLQIKNNENEMQQEAYKLLSQMEEERKENHKSHRDLRIEVAERQREKELEKVKNENEEAKRSLFERLVRGYHHAYKCITTRLKELMGKDYQAYIEQNEIEFPQIPSDSQMKTRYQQPEEAKSRITSHETEQELQKIDDMFKDYMALIKRKYSEGSEDQENDDEMMQGDQMQGLNPNDDGDNFDTNNNSDNQNDSDPNENENLENNNQ